jgi:competence ComEA-like helix-hairpin-helix protein
MKKIIKDYFSFSRKERVAAIVLLLLISVFLALPYFFNTGFKQPDVTGAVQELLAEQQLSFSNRYETSDADKRDGAGKLFEFDPNRIAAEQWLQLGLREQTVRTIMNYRSKGGRFTTATDIRKIWGLKKEEADRLIPYIRIASHAGAMGEGNMRERIRQEAVVKPGVFKATRVVDINTATTEEWKSLPGIGEVLSNRIVRFREKIGGFGSIQEVSKTYGLRDSVFQKLLPYLKLDSATITPK